MLERVKNYIQKWHMLESKDCAVVGVSGGADSICLLWMLSKLQKDIGFRMIVAHVNHGIRGREADDDEAFVKRICMELGVPCESCFANVELIAKKRKQSTEEAGREVRRDFFKQVLEQNHGTKIVLAHHQNDSVETFLMNLTRGTGLKGLGGIAPVNGNIIRPLLCLKREEIETYLKIEGVSYCLDATNQSDAYTRNRIRNHVLPYLQEEVNPKVIEHINETMEQIRGVQEFLEEQLFLYRKDCMTQMEKGYLVLAETYHQIPEVMKPLLLKHVLTEVCGKEKDLEAVHVKQVQELFEKQVGRKLNLPYRMEGKRVYQGVLISEREVCEKSQLKEVFFDIQEKEATYEIDGRVIQCRVSSDKVEKKNTKRFNCDIIGNNICIRTRRQGDYITIHPDGRTQKLKSFFINEKIPQDDRERILLVADGNHILWIVGYRTNPLYEVKANTNCILEIQIDEGENYGREN